MSTSIPNVMRKVLLATLPLATVSGVVLPGCSCPQEDLQAAFEVQRVPKSLDECLEMCRVQLSEHYKNLENNAFRLSKVSECTSTRIFQPGAQGKPGNFTAGVHCEYTISMACVAGRLPSGLQPQEQFQASNELGAYFAKMCFLEKAAVEAFSHLARELEAHDAPDHLIQRAKQAIQEEIEHAEMTALLTQMYDAEVPEVSLEPQPVRRIEALAYENAVEGCIHETFAPLTASWQAETSTAPEVRAVMSRIAKEESEHADLSWQIDDWITPRLTPDQRMVKDLHRRGAVMALSMELHHEPSKAMHEIAGMPSAAQAKSLFEGMKRELWFAS